MIAKVRAAIAELVAADRALVELALKDHAENVTDETTEYLAANERADFALAAVPWWVRIPADIHAARVNGPLWRFLWDLQAADRKAREQ